VPEHHFFCFEALKRHRSTSTEAAAHDVARGAAGWYVDLHAVPLQAGT
jgi:hypothetical protein